MTDRKKVIFLSQFFDPEPAYKGLKFVNCLKEMGFDVEVVTGFPNYPGGRLYDGYKIKLIQRELLDDIFITRLALYPSHNKNKFSRSLNYLTFMISAFLYLTLFCKKLDIVYVYSPPMTVGLSAVAWRYFFRRASVVIDIHDLWPDTLPATGMISNSWLLSLLNHAANWMYKHASFIILHTNGFKNTLVKRGVPSNRMQTVLGWADEYSPLFEEVQNQAELLKLPGLKLLYAGNIGPAQSLGTVIDAAAILQKRGQGALVGFYFLGDGLALEGIKTKCKKLNLKNVEFIPRVAPDEVKSYLSEADALLVHLRNDPLFEITLPSKTQAYMYASKPLLMAVAGEAAQLVKDSGAGVLAQPEDPESIASSALELAMMPREKRIQIGRSGRLYYDANLSMRFGLDKIHDILKKL